jgi:thioester reductase-like protein
MFRDDIRQIILLVRASSHDEARRRIDEGLGRSRLPRLGSPEEGGADEFVTRKLWFLAASLDGLHLGLSEQEYETIRVTADVVIHNAWAVNFGISIESFEAHHIRGDPAYLHISIQSLLHV